MTSLTDIQQDFVRRFMGDRGVIGVRVWEHNSEIVLLVDVEKDCPTELPETFRDLRVIVRQGERAVLAYC